MATVDEVMARLYSEAKPDQLEAMARYGMTTSNRLGVKIPKLCHIALNSEATQRRLQKQAQQQ